MIKKDTIIITIVLIVLVLGLTFGYKITSISSDYTFKIYFFNAGKADAILISKNDKYMLIDTGEETLSNELLRYFESNNIKKLEYLIITHFDKDHVGSASSVINNITINEVLQSNVPKESEYYTNYLQSLKNKNITPTTVTGNYEITLDDLSIIVNGPNTTYDSSESNNSSLIVSITNGEKKFLFMGDSENARIKDFLSQNSETYDFLKVPYHGNYLKRLDDLLASTKPSYAVMTCSSTEGCEEKTTEILNNYKVKYYMTKNGSISVLSNGLEIKIKE